MGTQNIPPQGATIFFGNHPNSLLDPGLISAFGERVIHFAAKDTLFSHRLIRALLTRMGAVPIKRKQDHLNGPLNNDEAFEALYRLLDRGGAMGIFPEGISHNGTQLAELKTGAARIALGARERGINVSLIPCGLHYVHRKRFRSSVLIQFGEPIIISQDPIIISQDPIIISQDPADEGEQPIEGQPIEGQPIEGQPIEGQPIEGQPIEGQTIKGQHFKGALNARELTDHMELHLRSLTVNAETWEDIALLDTVRRLYQPKLISLEDRVELARRFNRYYPEIKDRSDIQQLMRDISKYREDLYTLGLRDQELQGSLSASLFLYKLFRQLSLLLFWLPLSLVGSLIHFPLMYFLGRSSHWISPRKDVIATTKFLLGFLCLNALYLLSGVVAWWFGFGWSSTVFPLLLALSGFGTLKLVERGRGLWRIMWVWSRCISSARTIKELRMRRSALREEVMIAVDRYLPQDVERLFY